MVLWRLFHRNRVVSSRFVLPPCVSLAASRFAPIQNVVKTQTCPLFSPFRDTDLETAAVNGRKTMKRFLYSNEELLPGSGVTLGWEPGGKEWKEEVSEFEVFFRKRKVSVCSKCAWEVQVGPGNTCLYFHVGESGTWQSQDGGAQS